MAQAAMMGGLALMGGSSLMQFPLSRAAAKIKAEEAETAARAEELGAKQREVDRKQRLSAALASQNAMAGAKGIAAFEGSPLTILEADIAAEEEATERDIFQTRLRTESIRSGAKVRERIEKLGANIGLMRDVGQTTVTGVRAFR